MVYVKKGALIHLVEEDQVPRYKNNGFSVFEPAKEEPSAGEDKALAKVLKKATELQLTLPDDVSLEHAQEAVKQALLEKKKADAAAKAAQKAGGADGKDA